MGAIGATENIRLRPRLIVSLTNDYARKYEIGKINLTVIVRILWEEERRRVPSLSWHKQRKGLGRCSVAASCSDKIHLLAGFLASSPKGTLAMDAA